MNNSRVKNDNGLVGKNVGFERIRRITGYLVGTLDRFGDAKRSEVEERVRHGLGNRKAVGKEVEKRCVAEESGKE